MLLLEELLKLLWTVLKEGKANKEHINSQQYEFLKVASKAVRQTLSYIRSEHKRDTTTEEKLSELWANVALAARPFDSDLAERCYLKGNYWADPNSWSDEEVKNAGIEIGRIDTEIRNHFKGKARAKNSKQQKAIKKTEQGNGESKKKLSWKKLGTIVVSSILVLAALTTLILNLDKIKEIFRGETEKQTPSSKQFDEKLINEPGYETDKPIFPTLAIKRLIEDFEIEVQQYYNNFIRTYQELEDDFIDGKSSRNPLDSTIFIDARLNIDQLTSGLERNIQNILLKEFSTENFDTIETLSKEYTKYQLAINKANSLKTEIAGMQHDPSRITNLFDRINRKK